MKKNTTLGDLVGEERWVERRKRIPTTKKNTKHEQTQGRRREIKWWNSSLYARKKKRNKMVELES